MMLADIASGEVDLADILFLIAAILFGVSTVIRIMARSVDAALVAAGLVATALALLVL